MPVALVVENANHIIINIFFTD